jgi:hypothetical protein
MKKSFNAAIFSNTDNAIVFSKSKDEKVTANYNGNGARDDGADKIQIIGIKALSAAGAKYLRLCFIDRSIPGATASYYNGALFINDKRTEDKQPDYTGTVDLDREGSNRLRVAGWIKFDRNEKPFLSLSVSEFQATAGDAQEGDGTGAPAAADADFPF